MMISRLAPHTSIAARRDPFSALRNEFFRSMDGLFSAQSPQAVNWSPLWPKFDFSETETEFHLTMELPGMAENDVDVELIEGALKIRGEKKDERDLSQHHVHRIERSFGSFEQVIPLPKVVKRDEVAARFKNGVLEIVLPKQVPTVTQQKIAVQPG